MGKLSPTDIVHIIDSVTALVAAISAVIAAWQSTRAKDHAKAANAKLDAMADKSVEGQ